METPINLTARKNAIMRFILFAVLTLVFVLYHFFISLAAFKADYSNISQPEESSVIESLE